MNHLKENNESKRISRKTFALFFILSSLIEFIVFYFDNELYVKLFWSILLNLLIILSAWQRYQDMGIKGVNSLKLLIPLFNIYILSLLLFKKGDSKENSFGSPENFKI
ncbi:DUF805 domain-containing protein [Tenacibaculum singaporense]|uniref:DUF805 domain-containing protein n=1 Tax=Tenacibaculum singaporense TaxID=2358479 RepID=A0A3S8R7F7_9FLAO|nr:DUF805 domain-containing protein [Tenacibaculum singaporense]AZJ35698.1 DUF805 domain-containing protein [Tenacibaculum singaporense]